LVIVTASIAVLVLNITVILEIDDLGHLMNDFTNVINTANFWWI